MVAGAASGVASTPPPPPPPPPLLPRVAGLSSSRGLENSNLNVIHNGGRVAVHRSTSASSLSSSSSHSSFGIKQFAIRSEKLGFTVSLSRVLSKKKKMARGGLVTTSGSNSSSSGSAFPFPFSPETAIVVGRSAHCDVCLSKICSSNAMLGSVSRKHAVIVKSPSGDGFSIWDNNSTNGVFVNWVRIERSKLVALQLGDVIALGQGLRSQNASPFVGIGEKREFATDFAFTYIHKSAAPTPPPDTSIPLVGAESPVVASGMSPPRKRKRREAQPEASQEELRKARDALEKLREENTHLVSILNRLEDAFCCPVCLDLKKENLTFDCGHSCCTQCVQQLVGRNTPVMHQFLGPSYSRQGRISAVKCPMCRAENKEFKPVKKGSYRIYAARCIAFQDAINVYKDRWQNGDGSNSGSHSNLGAYTGNEDDAVVVVEGTPSGMNISSDLVDLT